MEEKKLNLKEKLQKIQSEMKAPKNLRNNFGNYNYRNAEGILEAFKPYGEKYKVYTVVTDNIQLIGDRYYVEATANLYDCESDEMISVSALAREDESKKGMDSAQLTGATSSYARKYALNGLFLLDDTKDQDSDEFHKETQAKAKYVAKETPKKVVKEKTKATESQINEILSLCNMDALDNYLKFFKVDSLKDLTMDQAAMIISKKKSGANG